MSGIQGRDKKRSWVIFEEAGIFTRHAFWRATTACPDVVLSGNYARDTIRLILQAILECQVFRATKTPDSFTHPTCKGNTRANEIQVALLRATLLALQTNDKKR
jgi:hypothetical protein